MPEMSVWGRPRELTLLRDVIHEPRTRWLIARMEEVLCWLLEIDLSLWKTRKRAREMGGHQGGCTPLEWWTPWLKGLARSGDVG